MDNRVYIAGCLQYDADEIEKIIDNAINELDNELIRPGMKVLVKANLLMKKRPQEVTTTHPAVIEAICRAVIKRGAQAIIGDSPGGPFTQSVLRQIYDVCGMADAAKNSGATLNFDITSSQIDNPQNLMSKTIPIINAVNNADLVISAGKLKTHGMVYYSGAVKNMFGAVPGLSKAEYHFRFPNRRDFCSFLVDVCQTSKPAISVIDGIWAMEGNGPSAGTARTVGMIMVSKNPHACDLAASKAIGFKTEEVLTLTSAIDRGLCPPCVDDLEIIGEPISSFEVPDFKHPNTMVITFIDTLPNWLRDALCDFLSPKPYVLKRKCIGCGKCAISCPAKTISIKQKKAVIDKSKCIKCYCCHELCPAKAIEVKKSLLSRLRR